MCPPTPPSPKGIYRPLLLKENESKNILSGQLDRQQEEISPIIDLSAIAELQKIRKYPSSLLDPKAFSLLAVFFPLLYLSNIIVFRLYF